MNTIYSEYQLLGLPTDKSYSIAKKDLRRRGFRWRVILLVSREGTVARKTFCGCFESNIGYNYVSVFVFSFLFYTDDVKEIGFDISY